MTKKLLLSLFVLFCISAFSSEPKIKVVINDFVDLSDQASSNMKTVTDVIKYRISLEEKIELIELDPAQQQRMRRHSADQNLKNQNIDYLISGDYQEIGGNISLHITLYNTTSRRSYFISHKPFKANELFLSLENITNDLVNSIYKNAQGLNMKAAAIICFKPTDGDPSLQAIAEDIQYAVYYNLPSDYSALNFSVTAKFCGNQSLDEIAPLLPEADILITASLENAERESSVQPKFYIAELGEYFEPLPYKTTFSRGYANESPEKFSRYLNKALESIVMPDGSWQVEAIRSESEGSYRKIMSELELRYATDSLNDYASEMLAKKAISSKPRRAEPYFYLGLIYEKDRKVKEAIANYETAIDNDPDLKLAYDQLGNLFMDKGHYDRAIALFQKADERFDDILIKLNMGIAYYFLGEMEQCIDLLAGTEFPADRKQEADYYLGEAYQQLGSRYFYEDYEKAIPYLEKALDYSESKYRIITLLVSAQNHLGRYTDSRKLMTDCLNKDWITEDFYLDQVEVLRDIKSPDGGFSEEALREAIKYLNTYLSLSEEKSPYPYQLLGSSHFRLSQLDSATYYYEMALDVDPESMANKLNLSEAAVMSGNYDIAETTLLKSLDDTFENARYRGYEVLIHYLLYVTHSLDGNDAEAKDEFEKIQTLLYDKNYKYLGWSFATFLRWLDAESIDAEKKEDIKNLTDQLVRELKKK